MKWIKQSDRWISTEGHKIIPTTIKTYLLTYKYKTRGIFPTIKAAKEKAKCLK